jgi:hypothetical protein
MKKMKMKSIWLVIAGFLLCSVLTWAAPLQDYSIGYTIKNPRRDSNRLSKILSARRQQIPGRLSAPGRRSVYHRNLAQG